MTAPSRDIEALEKKLAGGLRPAMWRKTNTGQGEAENSRRNLAMPVYVQAVERAKEYIAAGDIFQVVLSQRLDFVPEVDPFDIYRALRR